MQIKDKEEISGKETSAAFIAVSGKERYPAGSTRNIIPQKDRATLRLNTDYTKHGPS
jgi:hypothetical protein